jgi:putative nucleotidyltransferase with HDIG domain
MALFKHSTPRRREVRRSIPRRPNTWMQWIRQPHVTWAGLFAVSFMLIATLLCMLTSVEPGYTPDQLVERPIVPRVEFVAEDIQATRTKRETRRDMVPNVYDPNLPLLTYIEQQINELPDFSRFQSINEIPQGTRDHLGLTADTLAELRKHADNGNPNDAWRQLAHEFVFGNATDSQGLAGIALLSPEHITQERSEGRRTARIIVRHPKRGEEDRYTNSLFNLADDRKFLAERISLLLPRFPQAVRAPVEAIVAKELLEEPIYTYNAVESEGRRQIAFNSVEPEVHTYRPDQVLVEAGAKLTSDDVRLLNLEAIAYHDYLAATTPWAMLLQIVGRCAMIAVLTVMLWAYVLAYNDRIARNPMRGLAMMGLMVVAMLAALVASTREIWIYTIVLPTVIPAIVLAVAYDRRFALAMGLLNAFIIMVALGLRLDLMFVVVVGMGVAVAQLREVRTRSKLVLTGTWAGVAMAAAVLVNGFATRPWHIEGIFNQMIEDAGVVLVCGMVAGGIVQILLPMLESLFKVTTALSLEHPSDDAKDLLRRLAQEAPGTYQHSLRIADMAEAAAEAIGADALLCRAGAMYHDVGKINKPQYFVENQAGGPNRHEKLSPAMSLLIIVGHVKDGIEIAREYGIPPTLRHFIESHHGTTLVEYFYHAAKQRRALSDEPAPSEFQFRYPGPKPQTREAAIMMLCDCVEGAARTLAEPSPTRFEQLVHTLAQKRLMDGQFDECNLTLQDLARIEAAIIKTLCAMYHGRIAYPTESDDDATTPNRPTARPAASAS